MRIGPDGEVGLVHGQKGRMNFDDLKLSKLLNRSAKKELLNCRKLILHQLSITHYKSDTFTETDIDASYAAIQQ